jgi:hypothetical protein
MKTTRVPPSAKVIAAALPRINPKMTTAGRTSISVCQARDWVRYFAGVGLIRPAKGPKLNRYVTSVATDSKEET